MSLATTVVGLVIPIVTSHLVDHFSLSSLSMTQIFVIVGAFVIQAVALGLSTYFLNHVGEHIVANLRDRLWEREYAERWKKSVENREKRFERVIQVKSDQSN